MPLWSVSRHFSQRRLKSNEHMILPLRVPVFMASIRPLSCLWRILHEYFSHLLISTTCWRVLFNYSKNSQYLCVLINSYSSYYLIHLHIQVICNTSHQLILLVDLLSDKTFFVLFLDQLFAPLASTWYRYTSLFPVRGKKFVLYESSRRVLYVMMWDW